MQVDFQVSGPHHCFSDSMVAYSGAAAWEICQLDVLFSLKALVYPALVHHRILSHQTIQFSHFAILQRFVEKRRNEGAARMVFLEHQHVFISIWIQNQLDPIEFKKIIGRCV